MPSGYKKKDKYWLPNKFYKIIVALEKKQDKSMSIGVCTKPSIVWIKTLPQAEGVQEAYQATHQLHIPEQPDCPYYRGRRSTHTIF